ncbi:MULTISPECIES: hypothetical protein [Rhizobium]|uniref:hypothetical protein n=1 Tax=Rhizobium TaxID=379 RepID=UPI0014414712|nr:MULTISPECIES: hypothetical protein [Rhizobium]MBY3484060.1 hypothetical protein [Rhizobium laguerreae]MBY3556810.1 hypothetical protein [Rhizobium laguerreae]MBY5863835.1 hypothetical protein [Rhizobium leguminosarum]
MAKGECQINGPCPDRAGINDCLLPIESGAKLAPWILALSTGSRRVRAVEHSDYRIDINFVISPALISSTGRLIWG